MTPHSTYRHSVEAKRLLAKIAHQWGITKTASLEFMIRNQARQMGLLQEPRRWSRVSEGRRYEDGK